MREGCAGAQANDGSGARGPDRLGHLPRGREACADGQRNAKVNLVREDRGVGDRQRNTDVQTRIAILLHARGIFDSRVGAEEKQLLGAVVPGPVEGDNQRLVSEARRNADEHGLVCRQAARQLVSQLAADIPLGDPATTEGPPGLGSHQHDRRSRRTRIESGEQDDARDGQPQIDPVHARDDTATGASYLPQLRASLPRHFAQLQVITFVASLRAGR